MSLKQRVPLLRWSCWRLAIGACATSPKRARSATDARPRPPTIVVANARRGDIDDVMATIDEFAYEKSFLINVGDEKGELLDAAVRRANPAGAGAGHLLRLRLAADRPRGARRPRCTPSNSRRPTPKWPGASGRTPASSDRVTCVVGTIGDGGATLDALAAEHGFARRTARLPVPRPRQERLPARPAEHPRPRLAAPRVHRRRRQRPHPGRAEVPRVHERAAGQVCGTPSSTRPTSSTRRWCPTWCWSRST